MTKAERAHLDCIASMPCVVCGSIPAEVHHVRRYGSKRDHFQTAPLCPECHRGNTGIHGMGKKRFEREVMTQDELLRRTNELLKTQAVEKLNYRPPKKAADDYRSYHYGEVG